MTTTNEHIGALFVAALYYWITGEDETADMCLSTAVEVSQMMGRFVGDA